MRARRDRRACERVLAADRIHHEATARERERRRRDRDRVAAPAAAPQDRGDARGQLVRVEGLGQVVVGAHPQAGDALRVAALGRRDEDRDVAVLADRLEDRLAAEPGQHQVEHDEVDAVRLHRVDGRAAVANDRDRMAVTLEIEAQQLAEARLVLDDQDPCRSGHPRIVAGRLFRSREDADRAHTRSSWPGPTVQLWSGRTSRSSHRGSTPMPNFRTVGLAGAMVISALVGGTLISAVAASTVPATPAPAAPSVLAAPSGAPAARAVTEACATFRAAFAANLGVSEAEMVAAARKAAATTIDKAVADGDLPKAAGDRLKARLEKAPADGCAMLNGWRAKVAKGAVHVTKDAMTAAAEALKITPEALRAELRGGKTLKDVASAHGVPYATVTDAVVAAVKADLDAAVAAGTLKQARADRILERLKNRLADGKLRRARPAASPTRRRLTPLSRT